MADRGGSWEPLPSYMELLSCVYDYITASTGEWKTLQPPQDESWQCFKFSATDVFLISFVAATFTVGRYLMTEWCFKPLARYFNLTPANFKKMPESAWRLLFYFCTCSYTFYVIALSGRYRTFQNPSSALTEWSPNEIPPMDVYGIFMIQSGFYVHAIYTTAFLDTWRKDFLPMLVHHILTLILLSISHSTGRYDGGMVILLLHDICDILLEFGKLNIYFKIQGGKLINWHEVIANATFVFFIVTWFVSRLYFYPLKVLYTQTCEVRRLQLHFPCTALTTTLLWILQALNIYWFFNIIKILVFVFTGKMKEVDDIRECYDNEDFIKQQHNGTHIDKNAILLNRNNGSSKTAGIPVAHENDHGINLHSRRKVPH